MISYYFFDRTGGVSRGPYASLNVGHGLGDDQDDVAENRRRIKKRLGCRRLVSARQVHGNRVYAVADLPPGDEEVDGYDALITGQPGVGLLIQQADCQAVLLHDPVKQAIAAIHCGWRGSVADIIGATVAALTGRYGSNPADVQAAIGPSLGPCCAEFIHYREELPEPLHRFQVRPNYFDFWQISTWQLVQAGVNREAISISAVCTSCSPDYFSYRRACRLSDGLTGRHGSAIALDSEQPEQETR